MAITVEITQAAIVFAFKAANMPTHRYAGFEDGFKLGVAHREQQRLMESGLSDSLPQVFVEVVA